MAYTRTTEDEYQIWMLYPTGWTYETCKLTWKEARTNLKLYRENVPYPAKIVKKRVPLGTHAKDRGPGE